MKGEDLKLLYYYLLILPPMQNYVQGSVEPGNLGLPGQRGEGAKSHFYDIEYQR